MKAKKLEWGRSIIAGYEQARVEPGWMFLAFTIRDYKGGLSLTIDNSEGWEEVYQGASVEELKVKAQQRWDEMVGGLCAGVV